jgi:hypothetical protein
MAMFSLGKYFSFAQNWQIEKAFPKLCVISTTNCCDIVAASVPVLL